MAKTLTQQQQYIKVVRKKSDKGSKKVIAYGKHKADKSKAVKVKKQTKLPFRTTDGHRYWKFVKRPFRLKNDKFPYKNRPAPYRKMYQ